MRVGMGRFEIFAAQAEGPGTSVTVETGTASWGTGTSFTAEGRATADLGAIRPFLAGHVNLGARWPGPSRSCSRADRCVSCSPRRGPRS
jgi:hypothetical protein